MAPEDGAVAFDATTRDANAGPDHALDADMDDGFLDGLRTCGAPGVAIDDVGEAQEFFAECERFLGSLLFIFRPIGSVDFMSSVQAVDGNLTFRSTSLRSLSGLEALRTVNSLLLDDVPVSSLASLRNLREAPGGLGLENLGIASLTGLESLESVGELRIRQLPDVESLAPLSNVRRASSVSVRQTGISTEEFERFIADVEVSGEVEFVE